MPKSKPWMRPVDRIVAGALLAAACGIMIACAGGSAYQRPAAFTAYPADAALDEIIQTHVNAPEDRQERIVMTTWFQDGTPQGAAQFCSVAPDGRCSTYVYIHQTEFRAPKKTQLPQSTLDLIGQAIQTLPASQSPTLANMVIVSFHQNGAWQTRIYDRMRRPPGVSSIFELTGAPILP